MSNPEKDIPQAHLVTTDIPVLDLIQQPPAVTEYTQDYSAYQNQVNQLQQPQFLSKAGRKQKFTPEEDETLKQLVNQYGQDWKMISAVFKNRSARQCRDRWKHYLSPEVSRRPWTTEEDRLLLEKFREFGRQWAIIARFFPERTDIHIKNRWATLAPKLGFNIQTEHDSANAAPQMVDPQQPPQIYVEQQ